MKNKSKTTADGKKRGRGGRPRKYTKVEIMQQKIDAYFKKCETNKQTVLTKAGEIAEVDAPLPKTILGLALALDCDRHTLQEYEKLPEFSTTIKKAKAECAQDSILGAMTGRWKEASSIFNLKANHGWIETNKVDHTGIPPNQVLIIAPNEHSAVEEYGMLEDGESDEVKAPYVNIKQLNAPVNGKNGRNGKHQ